MVAKLGQEDERSLLLRPENEVKIGIPCGGDTEGPSPLDQAPSLEARILQRERNSKYPRCFDREARLVLQAPARARKQTIGALRTTDSLSWPCDGVP